MFSPVCNGGSGPGIVWPSHYSMAKPTIAHSRKYGKYEAFMFWTHPPVTPQCTGVRRKAPWWVSPKDHFVPCFTACFCWAGIFCTVKQIYEAVSSHSLFWPSFGSDLWVQTLSLYWCCRYLLFVLFSKPPEPGDVWDIYFLIIFRDFKYLMPILMLMLDYDSS